MNIRNIIIALCSFLFLMIGADKFMTFMEPPCSLERNISPAIWKLLGILQLASGILIWLNNYRKYVVGFWFVFMLVFTVIHLTQSTYDIGGSAFMAILLGLLMWNPGFLKSKSR